MDNLSRTQEILKGKGLTAEQTLQHITALEIDVAEIDHMLNQVRDCFHDLEYSDQDSCSQYNAEDVWSLLNIEYNRINQLLHYASDVIIAMKAQCAETEDTAKGDENMEMLLRKCSKHPELYNKVSNILYKDLGLQSAEVTLTCAYTVLKLREVEYDT